MAALDTAVALHADELRLAPEPAALAEHLAGSWDSYRGRLAGEGYVLWRGFGLTRPEDLALVVEGIDRDPVAYVGGNTPRHQLSPGVYTSTEYSPRYQIAPHQELSYEPVVPELVWFSALSPSATGGATTLADARQVTDRLRPDVVSAFARRRLHYVQRLRATRGVGRSWQEAFATTDVDAVDAELAMREVTWSWGEDASLVIDRFRDAVAELPEGGALWCNQADLWHPSSLDPATRNAFERLGDKGLAAHHVTFGDGGPIPDDVIAHIRAVVDSLSFDVMWQPGDVLAVDNLRTMHGRRPYTGSRQVVVRMSGALQLSERQLSGRHGRASAGRGTVRGQ